MMDLFFYIQYSLGKIHLLAYSIRAKRTLNGTYGCFCLRFRMVLRKRFPLSQPTTVLSSMVQESCGSLKDWWDPVKWGCSDFSYTVSCPLRDLTGALMPNQSGSAFECTELQFSPTCPFFRFSLTEPPGCFTTSSKTHHVVKALVYKSHSEYETKSWSDIKKIIICSDFVLLRVFGAVFPFF